MGMCPKNDSQTSESHRQFPTLPNPAVEMEHPGICDVDKPWSTKGKWPHSASLMDLRRNALIFTALRSSGNDLSPLSIWLQHWLISSAVQLPPWLRPLPHITNGREFRYRWQLALSLPQLTPVPSLLPSQEPFSAVLLKTGPVAMSWESGEDWGNNVAVLCGANLSNLLGLVLEMVPCHLCGM